MPSPDLSSRRNKLNPGAGRDRLERNASKIFDFLMRDGSNQINLVNRVDMNVTLVPKNRKLIYTFSMALVTIALVVGGGSVYLFEIKKNFQLAILLLFAGGSVVFLLLLAWPSSVAVLTMNEEGISDRRLGVGVILWSDIEDVQIENRYNNNQFICLRVFDPEKYISRLTGPKLVNMRHSQKLGFTMLNIDVSAFDTDPLELMEHIRKSAAAYRGRRV